MLAGRTVGIEARAEKDELRLRVLPRVGTVVTVDGRYCIHSSCSCRSFVSVSLRVVFANPLACVRASFLLLVAVHSMSPI